MDELFIPDGIVRFAAKSSRASLLGCRNSMRCHLVHYRLPSSLRHFWIVGREVSASEIEVQGWLAMGFVHRIQQPFGFASVVSAKRSLF